MNAPNERPPAHDGRDAALRVRAQRVIPGGMYGHQRAQLFPTNYPQFLESGSGALIRDVDGREFVDFLCGYGPIVLGYGHAAVEAAAAAQRSKADCQNLPSARVVELAEMMVGLTGHADWAMFAKNGTDGTTTALTIARAATGKSVILVERNSYHGAAPWCTPGLEGVTSADRANIRYFDYNDLPSLATAWDEAADDLAGIIITPFKHNDGVDQEDIHPAFARELRRLCDSDGAVLILDDVRAGMRLHHGSSWETFDVQPDISVWGKAIANGYPLSAILGRQSLREAAAAVFSTGTYWYAAVPMAASLATIRAIEDEDAIGAMARAGLRFKEGLTKQATSHGFDVSYTGPVQMPYMRFLGEHGENLNYKFAAHALDHGVYLHPRHNWFVSAAHSDAIIDRALEGTDHALAALARDAAP